MVRVIDLSTISLPTLSPGVNTVALALGHNFHNAHPTSTCPQIEESVQSKTPSVNHEAEALREELESANNRVTSLQESLQERADANEKLGMFG